MTPTDPRLIDLARLLAARLQPPPRSPAEMMLETIQSLADYLPHIVWISDPIGRVIHYNRAFYAYAGRNDLMCWDLMHPDDVPVTEHAWSSSVISGDDYEHLLRLRHHSGAYRWHLERAAPVRCPDGSIACWVGVSVDSEPVLALAQQRAAA